MKKLKKGDNIFLLCPSSPILKEDIQICENVIKELGYNAVLGKSLFENYGGYMSGKSDVRIEDLHEAFSREDIKAIFCVKGGYSASQLLDKIDYELIKKNPKIFVGYSDVTNLHIVFNQKCNMLTYHGPMVKSNMFNDFNVYTKNSFFEALESESWEFKNPDNLNVSILKNKCKTIEAEGTLIGGNLAIIVTTLGTPNEIDTKGKILFLEDVDEQIGSLDRMLTHLKYANKFDDCEAVILGNFADCENKFDENYKFNNLLNDFFSQLDKPVLYNVESGHAKPFMATLPLGAKCKINGTKIIFEK